MQQIADWLKTLGLSEYAERFAESDIDTSVLCDLTDQDLKELGVSLGHRRKMLRAIAELAGVAPTSPQPALTEPTKSQDTAERRQVTVMFSDLVGSTALAGRMDPEDLREIISAYQKCVAETVRRLGGFVAKYLGDGVLVYFGHPQAHEDDAERSVRAGLELIEAVGGLKLSTPLQTRVGIATGLVVVGDVIGSGEAQERGIVGEIEQLSCTLGNDDRVRLGDPLQTRCEVRRGVGQRQRPAKAKWCPCRERQALASHGSRRRCLSASLPSRTLVTLLLLPSAHRQRVLSDHQPNGACG
jgi:class 3 adenylate cyclase